MRDHFVKEIVPVVAVSDAQTTSTKHQDTHTCDQRALPFTLTGSVRLVNALREGGTACSIMLRWSSHRQQAEFTVLEPARRDDKHPPMSRPERDRRPRWNLLVAEDAAREVPWLLTSRMLAALACA